MPFYRLNGHGDLMMRNQAVGVLNALEPPQGQHSIYVAGYTEALKRVAAGLGIGYQPPLDIRENDASLDVARWENCS